MCLIREKRQEGPPPVWYSGAWPDMESGGRNFRDNQPCAFPTCLAPVSTRASPSKCLHIRAIHSNRGHLEEKAFAAARSSSLAVIHSLVLRVMGVLLAFSASLIISTSSGSERDSARKSRSLPLEVLIRNQF